MIHCQDIPIIPIVFMNSFSPSLNSVHKAKLSILLYSNEYCLTSLSPLQSIQSSQIFDKSPCLLSPQIPNSRLPNLHLRLEYPTVKSTDYMKYTMDLHLTNLAQLPFVIVFKIKIIQFPIFCNYRFDSHYLAILQVI